MTAYTLWLKWNGNDGTEWLPMMTVQDAGCWWMDRPREVIKKWVKANHYTRYWAAHSDDEPTEEQWAAIFKTYVRIVAAGKLPREVRRRKAWPAKYKRLIKKYVDQTGEYDRWGNLDADYPWEIGE